MRRILPAIGVVGLLLFAANDAGFTAHADEARPPESVNTRYLLSDTAGHVVNTDTFEGRFQLLTFGYTACEEVCPATLTTIGLVLRELGDRASKVQAIFISVDAGRDTLATLRNYLTHFDSRIVGLTGPAEFVQSAAEHFHVIVQKTAGAAAGDYIIDHTAGYYVLGRDGEFLGRLAYGMTAEDISGRLRKLVDAPESGPLPPL